MKNRKVVLSIDYEIFGDGSGDVRQHMINPTERMARICEKHGVALTVFFEVEEYLAFVREREILKRKLGYDPAEEVRHQACDLIRRGHDMQLHLHPEWVGAVYEKEQWRLKREMRTVDSLFDTQDKITQYIAERKAVIDGLYQQVDSKQRVSAFRAGAFCAQPGRKLLRGLADNGIIIDSSLVKGMVTENEHMDLDYSNAPDNRRHWRVKDDVACENTEGQLFEVPIYSRMGRRIQQLTPWRILAKLSYNIPRARKLEIINELGIGRTPASVIQFLLRRFPIKLDFHNMSSNQMLRWISDPGPVPDGDLDVIVLIGHSKEHRDDCIFDRLLSGIKSNTDIDIISMNKVGELLEGMLMRGNTSSDLH